MLLAMDDTLERHVGERFSIRILLSLENGNTSKKLCPKKRSGSFDQLDMHSLNDYMFFFFVL